MVAPFIRALFGFFLPGGLLLLTGLLFAGSPGLLHWRPLAAMLLLWLAPFVALLGWSFNRFKPFWLVLALLLVERSVRLVTGTELAGPFFYDLLAVMLPLNFLLLALGRERGFMSGSLVLKTAVIGTQLLLVMAVAAWRPELLARLASPFLPAALALPLFSHAGQLAFGSVLAVLLFRLAAIRGTWEIACFWALLTVCLGLAFPARLPTSLAFGLAGLILAVSIVGSAHSMAYRDELTGLPGRRALNEYFQRLAGPYTVAMLDVDFFKKFNDTYGHEVGDQVLKMVAARVGRVGGGGRSFRYGGEEFAVVFPGRSAPEAIRHLEALRLSVQDAGFTLRAPGRWARSRKGRGRKMGKSKRVGVTVSIGVAERQPDRLSPLEVFKKADKALYEAKNSGRNRVVG